MIINATNDYILQKTMKPECRAGVGYEVIERVPITFDQWISQLFMITGQGECAQKRAASSQ